MNLTEQIQDEVLFLATQNERFKRQTATRIITVLRGVEQEILEAIAIEGLTEFRQRRLNALLKRVNELLVGAFGDAEALILDAGRDSTNNTLERLTGIHEESLTFATIAGPSVNAAYTAALAQPFQGRLLRDHWAKLPNDVARSLENSLRIGYGLSETQGQIFARARKVFRNQKTNFTRAITNTALAHFQSFAHDRFYEANSDIYKGKVLQATLDLRTSQICQSRDGRFYRLGTEPKLPFHFNERSEYIGVLKNADNLPFNVPEGQRPSLDGAIPARVNYKEFIGRSSFSRQSEVFGRGRATLLRDSSLSVDDLFGVDRVLRLDEIRAKFPEQYASVFDV